MPLSKWVDYSNEDSLVQIVLNMLSESNNIQEQFLFHVTNNRFIGQKNIDIITSIFRQSFRNRFLIEKTIRRWIFRRKNLNYINDTDLLLEPFDNNKKYAEIIEGNGIYRFSSGDIFNMIINKVVYSEYQIPRILPIKNAWSNKIFNKTELYNLFVSSYKITKTPWIMTEYAKVDFDNKKMLNRHKSYLNEQAVILDISNFSESEFRKEAEYIFVHNIFEPLKKYKIFKYSTLKIVPIKILRKYFKQIIIDNHLRGGISLKISPEKKKLLFKLWNDYPGIIAREKVSKKRFNKKRTNLQNNQSNNFVYEQNLARARGRFAYNDILYYSQASEPPNGVNLSSDLPEIFNIEFADIEFRNNQNPQTEESYWNTSTIAYFNRNIIGSAYDNIYRAISQRPFRQSSFFYHTQDSNTHEPNIEESDIVNFQEPTSTERMSIWNEINTQEAPAPEAPAPAPAPAPAIAFVPEVPEAPAPENIRAQALSGVPLYNQQTATPDSRPLFVFGNNISNPQSSPINSYNITREWRTRAMSIDENLESDYDY